MNRKISLNGAQLKIIAMAAMTVDHLTSVLWPDYPTDWRLLLCHIFGRLAAPIFWFLLAEGYHYTHSWKKYAVRLFLLAVISHFAYDFAFGIPFVPFQSGLLNQTSVIWSLFWGLIALVINDDSRLKQWHKTLLVVLIVFVSLCSDWSCIAVLSILWIGDNRGNFKKQMCGMMFWVCFYVAVYMIFINAVYGFLQLFVALSIPVLALYNGKKGGPAWLNRFFYFYYPAHLVVCGLIRIALAA